jgi:hypothetical protein
MEQPMPQCQYHQEFDGRLRECEEAKVLTAENVKKIETLFTYHDEMRDLIRTTERTLDGLKSAQHSWAGSLSGQLGTIKEMLQEHLSGYREFKKEVNGNLAEFREFRWFRLKMNWLKECLPWWVMGMILLLVAGLIVSFEGVKRISEFFRW